MGQHALEVGTSNRSPSLLQLRVWQLALLVLYAAIMTADLKAQRHHEPVLLALAAAGLAAYAVICWLGWNLMRRLEPRLGLMFVTILHATAMAALFLISTVAYLLIEWAYLGGRFV